MQAWRRGSTIFAAFLFLLFAFAIITAFTYNERARAAPLVIAVPGLLLMLGWLVMEVTGRAATKKKHAEEPPAGAQASGDVVTVAAGQGGAAGELALQRVGFRKSAMARELQAFAWILGLFVMLYLLGFYIALPLFTFLYMKVRSHDGWAISIALPVACWVIMYFMFEQIAHFILYPGLIANLLG